MSLTAPTFEELATLSRKRSGDKQIRISFEHGTVSFGGRISKKRADLSADLIASRDILPEVTKELEELHGQYLDTYPEVKRGGASSKFGRTVIHCHVRIDADEWLKRIFEVVSDAENLQPARSMDEVMNDALGALQLSSEPEEEQEQESEQVKVGEKSSTSTIRLGQARFSRTVKRNYGGKCCFPSCDVDDERLLIGAHIERWADSPESRGDPSNGLCLCALHDKAFELGLFVLTDDFCVEVQGADSDWAEQNLMPYDGDQIRLGRTKPSVDAIRSHRKRHK